MSLVIQKYGGSSLATPAHIRRAAARIHDLVGSGHELVVVVSAMGHMTDHLIRVAKRVVAEPPQRELDMLMTAGERVSMALLAMALQERGVPAISFTGSQSGIVTSNHHTNARIIDIRATRIQQALAQGKVVIVAGFQGVSLEKEITTLGRGGSDTTAVALAAALKADRCEILTDVDGLFTADPRLVPSAKLIERCSYEEGVELASLGAKMHARSLALAKRFGVNVWISSSRHAQSRGTWLRTDFRSLKGERMESTLVCGITTRDGYHYFRVRAGLRELLTLLRPLNLGFRFFQGGDESVEFLCEKDRASEVRQLLSRFSSGFEEIDSVVIVSAVGEGIGSSSDLIPDFLEAATECGTRCLMLTSNSLSVTMAVSADAKAALARRLHERWIGETHKKEEPPREGALHVGGEATLR